VRRAVLVICSLLVAGCGASGDVRRIHAFQQDVPYLPPRAPETAARHSDDPQGVAGAAHEATTAQPASENGPASGAPSDAEVAAELRQAFKGTTGKASDIVDRATLTTGGLASTPPTAPAKVMAMISAANQVARKPYVYGGGHGGGPEGLFTDSAYDCSGSVSYALAAAGYIDSPMDSTTLSKFGKPGPGRWVTIYANAGHAFMVVAGLR
jgi:cell wall-associated NlpC family hydrolase